MEKIVYQGKIIEVVQKEVGSKTFEFARRSPGTRLIVDRGNQVLLTKEFRHELNAYDYRLPGGKVYDTLGEYNKALESGVDIMQASKVAIIKEAKEEAGLEIKNVEFIHRSICGTTITWDLFYFVSKEFKETDQNLGEGEDITFEFYEKEKVKEMCLDGSISEERSALVLLKYLINKTQ